MKSSVSVVTATKNRRGWLEHLIKSVLSQTYRGVEHVIVDGLSGDGTVDLIRSYAAKYPDRIRWISEKDRNQVGAINKGLKMARGEFITITHDDDYWLPEGIGLLMDYIAKNPDTDILYGDSWGEFEDGRRERRNYKCYTVDEMINEGYQIPQDGAIFKKSWLDSVGYLDENLEYVPEYELFLRIILSGGKHAHLSEVTGVGGLHGEKKSWVGSEKAWDETWIVNRKYGGGLFSKFSLSYVLHRHFRRSLSFMNKYLSPLARFIKKRVARLPSYD